MVEDEAITVEVKNSNGVRSESETEVLVHICPGILSELEAIIPDLHLTDGHRFACVSDDVNCGHANDLIWCGRYDLQTVDERLHIVGY